MRDNKNKKTKLKDNLWQCNICGKIFSDYGIRSHMWRAHTENGRTHSPNPFGAKYRVGKTYEELYGIERSKKYKQKLRESHHSTGRASTPEKEKIRRQRISETMKRIKSNPNANIKGGRCKGFEYKGAKLQGTGELKFAKLCDKKDIKGEKNQKYIYEYLDDENKKHYYRPDFYLPEIDRGIEIKGYGWGKDKEKMRFVFKQNPNHKLKIIKKKQLKDLELLVENNMHKKNLLRYIIEKSFKL